MDHEIELISDGDGLAVVGSANDVELFLEREGLTSKAVALPSARAALKAGAAVMQPGSEMAANSSRWVKLTSESATAVQKYGLTPSTTPGVSHAMIGQPGAIQQWIQVVTGPGSLLTNPAVLAGAAGVMSQLAMQQTMDEITDYLATIDKKLDAVIRSQTNQVLAQMDGVALAVAEATSVKTAVGRVSDVTWSKVQHSSSTILSTQGYALRQLADLADELEQTTKIDDLAKTAQDAETDVQKWLMVLARCFQLHDAVAVLELDRVMDASPEELDQHRVGLKAARQDRLALISQSTARLLERMDVAVETANSKVLLHPTKSPAVVESRNLIATDVLEFHELLAIESGHESSETRRWGEAAAERWDRAYETGAGGVGAARQFGNKTRGQARSMKDKLAEKLADRRAPRNCDETPVSNLPDVPGRLRSEE